MGRVFRWGAAVYLDSAAKHVSLVFFFVGEEQVTREEAPTAKSTNGMNKHNI